MTLYLYTMIVSQQLVAQTPSWFPVEAFNETGFRVHQVRRFQEASLVETTVQLTRANGVRLQVTVATHEQYGREFVPTELSASAPPQMRVARSGFGFGKVIWRSESTRSWKLFCEAPNDSVTLTVEGARKADGRSRTFQEHGMEGSEDWFEDVARLVLASSAGNRAKVDSTLKIGSQQVSRYRTEAGTILVSLEEWASAKGLSIRSNARRTRFSFSSSGGEMVVPMASLLVKRQGKWIELPDLVMIKNGKVLVPLGALQ